MSTDLPSVPSSIAGLPLADIASRTTQRLASASERRVDGKAVTGTREAEGVANAERQIPVGQRHADGRRPWEPDVVSLGEAESQAGIDEAPAHDVTQIHRDDPSTGTQLDISG